MRETVWTSRKGRRGAALPHLTSATIHGRATISSAIYGRPASNSAVGWTDASRRSSDTGEHQLEHRDAVVPVAVLERELIDVALQPLPADVVLDAGKPALHVPEKSLDGLSVDVASGVNAFLVLDLMVCGKLDAEFVVQSPLVRVKRGLGADVGSKSCADSFFAAVRKHDRPNATAALHHGEDRRPCFHPLHRLLSTLCRRLGARAVASPDLSAPGRLIDFDVARKRSGVVVVQHPADPVVHAPRGLVRHAKFALKLLGGDSAARLTQKEDRVEPQAQWRGGLRKDRSRC